MLVASVVTAQPLISSKHSSAGKALFPSKATVYFIAQVHDGEMTSGGTANDAQGLFALVHLPAYQHPCLIVFSDTNF
jgi:hypothetical protein